MVVPQSPTDRVASVPGGDGPIRGNRTSFQSKTLRSDGYPQRISSSVRNIIGEKRRQITLDWKEYFLSFCKLHGEPVQLKDTLLFRDGWRYTMDYKGPEFPPPTDHTELDKLVTMYWLSRHRTVTSSLARTISERDKYVGLMKTHSLPLQQTTIVTEGENRRKTTGPFNLKPLDERVRWLRMDLIECEEHLKELQSFTKGNNGTSTGTAATESSTSDV